MGGRIAALSAGEGGCLAALSAGVGGRLTALPVTSCSSGSRLMALPHVAFNNKASFGPIYNIYIYNPLSLTEPDTGPDFV